MRTVKELETAVNDIAVELMGPIAPCHHYEDYSCVRKESKRLLSIEEKEKKRNWGQRPFYGYDPSRMCSACAAYWHASMARLCLLDEMRRDEIMAGDAPPLVGRL